MMKANSLEISTISNLGRLMNGDVGSMASDLSDVECALLLEDFNIKIVKAQNGYMAYYGIKIGLSGVGSQRIQALASLLRRFNCEFRNESDFTPSMLAIFK